MPSLYVRLSSVHVQHHLFHLENLNNIFNLEKEENAWHFMWCDLVLNHLMTGEVIDSHRFNTGYWPF